MDAYKIQLAMDISPSVVFLIKAEELESKYFPKAALITTKMTDNTQINFYE